MNTKLLGAAIAAFAVTAPAVALAQSGAAVLVVDTDRVAAECNACKLAGTQFQTMYQQAQQRAQTLNTQLQTAGAPIQTAVNALNGKAPDAALTARINAFKTQESNANTEVANSQQRLQSIGANIQRQIGEKLAQASDAVMKTRGASVVLARNATLANADAIDVTNDVLAQLNAQLPSVSLTPLPQPTGAPATAPTTTPAPAPTTTPRRSR